MVMRYQTDSQDEYISRDRKMGAALQFSRCGVGASVVHDARNNSPTRQLGLKHKSTEVGDVRNHGDRDRSRAVGATLPFRRPSIASTGGIKLDHTCHGCGSGTAWRDFASRRRARRRSVPAKAARPVGGLKPRDRQSTVNRTTAMDSLPALLFGGRRRAACLICRSLGDGSRTECCPPVRPTRMGELRVAGATTSSHHRTTSCCTSTTRRG